MPKNNKLAKILIVEDELSMRQLLEYIFGQQYCVSTAKDGKEARELLAQNTFEIIIQDMRLPDIDGIDLLKEIRKKYPASIIIVITAFSGWQVAMQAMRLGAFEYVKKPFDNENIRQVVAHALQYKKSLSESSEDFRETIRNIVGNSLQIKKIQDIIRRVAPTDATIFIYGESGTGKELVARAIHLNSRRRENVFIPVNCGAISESLIESELFGHVKGAFTHAIQDKKGLFEIANEGTLFLDEIGEMILQTQVKFLRVLEEKQFMPLGGTQRRKISARFIIATNRDLEEQVRKGEFRQDLYYRLNVIPIKMPPLRERKEDIALLAGHFLSLHASRFNKRVVGISEEVMQLFLDYDWPGNVRELGNLIQRAVLMGEGEIIKVQDLGEYIPYKKGYISKNSDKKLDTDIPDQGFDLTSKMEEIEKEYIYRSLKKTKGNITNAAKLLNLSFRSLRYKIKKYKITSFSETGE